MAGTAKISVRINVSSLPLARKTVTSLSVFVIPVSAVTLTPNASILTSAWMGKQSVVLMQTA